MSIVKITNGFHNFDRAGLLLTGILTTGSVDKDDWLILDNGVKIPIMDVEFDKDTFPGTTHVRLMVSREHKIIWHKLYDKEFTIEKHSPQQNVYASLGDVQI